MSFLLTPAAGDASHKYAGGVSFTLFLQKNVNKTPKNLSGV